MAAPIDAEAEVFGTFDFGLDADQEARAQRLHRESVIIDMLFQGPCGWRALQGELDDLYAAAWDRAPTPLAALEATFVLPLDLALDGRLPEYRAHWEASGITGGNLQFSLEPHALLAAFSHHTALVDRLSWLRKALVAQDFRDAHRDGGRAGFLSTQDTTGIERETAILDTLYGFGARVIGLTYNTQNYIGSGCTDRADGGISDFGAQFIKRMNELGIIVDTGHSGTRTTIDACAISSKPVIASHTAAKTLLAHDRNKTDEELRAIAATGGVIGVYAVPFFLAGSGDVTISALLDHIEYIAGLVGWQHVGIGTDWPVQHGRSSLARLNQLEEALGFRPEHRIDWLTSLLGFSDYRDFPNLTRGLVQRGCSDEQIRGVLGENFLRVFGEVCG